MAADLATARKALQARRRYNHLRSIAAVVTLDEARRRLTVNENPVISHPTLGTISGWRARWAPTGNVPAWRVVDARRNERITVGIEDLTDARWPRPTVFATDDHGPWIVDPATIPTQEDSL